MAEDLKGRTCQSCACVYIIEPPRVPTAQQLRDNPGILSAKPVLVCRLNPPTTVHVRIETSEWPVTVPKIMQQPTEGYISCWHWKPAGTLPGDTPQFDDSGVIW